MRKTGTRKHNYNYSLAKFTYDLYNLHVTVLVFQKEISSYDLLLAITLLVIVNSMNY